MRLTRLEIEALRTGRPLATDNKREMAEWEEKKNRLGC
jgi:thymidylate synthase (FAD)